MHPRLVELRDDAAKGMMGDAPAPQTNQRGHPTLVKVRRGPQFSGPASSEGRPVGATCAIETRRFLCRDGRHAGALFDVTGGAITRLEQERLTRVLNLRSREAAKS